MQIKDSIPPIDEIRTRAQHESPDSYEHVLRTAALARELAGYHGVDPNRAEAAALMHDIADRYSDKDLLGHAKRFGIALTATESRVPKLIHGKVGAEILRSEWHVTDEEVLEAVRIHISGSAQMGLLAKVVFVADKLEPNRDRFYGGLDDIREIAKHNLDEAILKLFAWQMQELQAESAPVHEDLADALNALTERTQAGA